MFVFLNILNIITDVKLNKVVIVIYKIINFHAKIQKSPSTQSKDLTNPCMTF